MRTYNIRIYGIYLHQQGVLVSDEFRMGMLMTKFPGGGLEAGEGTIDALKRECIEEFGQAFEVREHFYTTDFYIHSAFNAAHQLLSIYYFIEPKQEIQFKVSDTAFDFERVDGAQSFRWIKLSDLSEESFTFPIDKLVAKLLLERYL
jgi:ADP-ribose pyrophosphatase YjhB (NUDIX family)